MTQLRPGTGNWNGLLARTARRQPERTAFDFLADGERPTGGLSYAQLDLKARAIGSRLHELGLAGQRALLLYPPGVEYVAAFFGCLYAGAVAVPAYPPTRRPRSLERILGIIADCGATTALTTAEFAARLGEGMASAAGLRVLATDTVPDGYADGWADPGSAADTPAFVQYTSGSTGTPRGVVLTHGNLLANAGVTQRLFGTSEETRVVSWLPMYHDMGLIGSVLGTVYCGGSCTLMSPTAFVQRPARWLEAISSTAATASGAPDFAYQLCVERVSAEERAALDLSSWEVAFDGAEPIRPQTLRRFAETFAECGFRAEALTPCYGLAEATLLVSSKVRGSAGSVDPSPPGGAGPVVSCGTVPNEHRVRIADPASGRIRPDGEVGEVWVASPGVAEGYHGRPEESEAVFRAVLEGDPDTRYLRTGDLGYLRDGELYIAGRLKDLVIVRGRNHYPQDIEETAEQSHRALSRGGGAAFAVTVDGAEELVVVHEVDRSYDGDLGEAAEAVGAAVASAHGVRPHAVVLIRTGGLPRTSSGKVQRRTCREDLLAGALPELARTDAAPAPAPAPGVPQDAPVLGLLRTEIQQILGGSSVAEDRPLVLLGLDSLGAVRLQHRIELAFGRRVDFEELSERSLSELAAMLADSRAPLPEAAPAPADDASGDRPLTDGQRAQWLAHRLAPAARGQVIAAAVDVHSALDPDALERALRGAVRRHPALRGTVGVVDGEPVRRILADLPPGFTRHDASHWSPATLRSRTEDAAYQPFDLEHGPLLRAAVFSSGPEEHRLVLSVHHLAADLWSLELLLAEIDRRYPAELGGRATGPDPLTGPGPGPATPLRLRTPEQDERLWAYWRSQLRGAPTSLPLPTDRNRPAVRCLPGDAVRLAVGRELTTALTALAAEERTTPYTVFMAAWQVLLSRLSSHRDLLVATPVHGRQDPADAARIDLLADVVPVRGQLSPDEDFRALLRRTHVTVRDAVRHAGLSFPSLVERLNPQREAGRPALAQAVLTVHRPTGAGGAGDLVSACALGVPGVTGTLGGLRLESVAFTPPPSQFELGLTLAALGGGFSGLLHFDPDVCDRTTAERRAESFTRVLADLVADPGSPLGRPGLLEPDPAPRPRRREPVRRLRPVHEQFADRASRSPDRTALRWADGSLSYRQLDARANQLAHRLRAAGVGPESFVALCLPRSPELVVAVLAVAKAGGAYVPLDPAHPADRIAFVLDDTRPGVVVATSATLASLPDHPAEVIDLDAEAPALRALSEQAPDVAGDLDRLAYVIHTSGSTGRPKGVLVEHRGVANLFAAAEDFRFDHTDVWTLFHSYAFDFSVWELWGPLVHGGTLVVVPTEATLSPAAFWDLLRRHRVTVLNQTPAVFAELTAACPDRLAGLDLRHIVFGGEKLDSGHLRAWRAHGDPLTRLTNMYGITEITVHASYGPLADDAGADPIDLGEALAGTDLTLRGPDGAAPPAGEPGEICIGGAGVARGYLNRAALTAERFVPHPDLPGRRMYRSGDLARIDPAGRLVYLGRADDQVKIRGHRVEPGEIAAALLTHPDVRQAVVVPWTDPGGQTRLVGYVTAARPGSAPAAARLRAHLRTLLPEYLVPGAFVTVEAIPVTANGKVDRRALPSPVGADASEPSAPASATEATVGGFVAEMLAVAAVGRDDDLFALGWHSLLMARLALRTEEHFGVRVPLEELFVEPTVARIAAAVDRGAPRTRDDPAGDAIVPADRSLYAAARRADGTAALPETLARTGARRT